MSLTNNSVPANDVTCDPSKGILTSCSLSERLADTSYVMDNLFKWEHLVFIALIFLFLFVARWTYWMKLWLFAGRGRGYSCCGGFGKALSEDDNKAVATSFAGYVFAVGMILWSSLTDLGSDQGKNILLIIVWQAIGVLLLELARVVNDFVILSPRGPNGVKNNEELLRGNVAVGAAEAGSYVSCGMVIMASTSGPASDNWLEDIGGAAMWFALGQIAFVLFAFLINCKCITRFHFTAEIKKQNAAAGVLLALEMIAVANLITNSILKSDSLVTFGVWYLLGGIALIAIRFLVDLVVIPSQSLNDEIEHDKNLGAAILVGGIPVGLSFVINTFLPDTCLNNT